MWSEEEEGKKPILFLPKKYYWYCVWMCESKGHPFLSYNQPLESIRLTQQAAGFSNHHASCGTGCQRSAGKQQKQAYREVSLLSLASPSLPQSLLSAQTLHSQCARAKQGSSNAFNKQNWPKNGGCSTSNTSLKQRFTTCHEFVLCLSLMHALSKSIGKQIVSSAHKSGTVWNSVLNL